MIQVSPGTKIFLCVEIVDFRCGVDGLKEICKIKLRNDPFSGAIFLFRNRRRNSIKILSYDGQGFWLLQKRLSQGTFKWWPTSTSKAFSLNMYELQILLGNGNPKAARVAKDWRKIN